MAISYNWTCTACGATNPAGTTSCGTCGANAIIAAVEIGVRPLGRAKRLALGCCLAAIVVGIVLERGTVPPDVIWYMGVGLAAFGGISLGVMAALQRRK
jgi:hypothetical protein